jgi:hypothetical protein
MQSGESDMRALAAHSGESRVRPPAMFSVTALRELRSASALSFLAP